MKKFLPLLIILILMILAWFSIRSYYNYINGTKNGKYRTSNNYAYIRDAGCDDSACKIYYPDGKLYYEAQRKLGFDHGVVKYFKNNFFNTLEKQEEMRGGYPKEILAHLQKIAVLVNQSGSTESQWQLASATLLNTLRSKMNREILPEEKIKNLTQKYNEINFLEHVYSMFDAYQFVPLPTEEEKTKNDKKIMNETISEAENQNINGVLLATLSVSSHDIIIDMGLLDVGKQYFLKPYFSRSIPDEINYNPSGFSPLHCAEKLEINQNVENMIVEAVTECAEKMALLLED